MKSLKFHDLFFTLPLSNRRPDDNVFARWGPVYKIVINGVSGHYKRATGEKNTYLEFLNNHLLMDVW